jgi:alpha-L-fucosidase 2
MKSGPRALPLALASLWLASVAEAQSVDPLSLWYDEPAQQWTEALPVGNGRLGGMVFGGVAEERIQLSEDTLWAGGPYDPVNPDARGALPGVRQAIFAGDFGQAVSLISERVLAEPLGQMPYQTVGNLVLRFDRTVGANADRVGEANVSAGAEPTDNVSAGAELRAEAYRRDLDLDTAVAAVSYRIDGVTYRREVFSSAPDDVIVVRLSADAPGRISFTASMNTPMSAALSTDASDTLVLAGRGGSHNGIEGQLTYQARVKVIAAGGVQTADADSVAVRGADAVTLLISAATSFVRFDDVSGNAAAVASARIAAAAAKSYAALRAAHIADYQRLFRRVSVDLGRTAAAQRPTDERIAGFASGDDPALAALYYQYGRYLLISSSRPGTQPANLQGIWNESLNPPWQSKYTININTEMNYWPAESGNLAETLDPLIAMVLDLTQTGARTAAAMYGARGWVAHHNTDIWRATAPIDGPNWGMWPTGGAWLCLHLWDHYEYSGDRALLERFYPVFKGAAEFFVDTLVEDPGTGWLVTNPSLSPENPHAFGAAVVAGPTMDMQILRDLFANTIKAAKILDVDADLQAQLGALRGRLAPNQIGAAGQLQEWLQDWDLDAPERSHRHVSHLYGLYPGRDIHRRDTPALAAAVQRSLEIRGDRGTGWATAWRIALWTHLGDGEHAYRILTELISPELTYPNMFDAHPPFQIDGNFGGASSIADMIVQSRIGTVTAPFDTSLDPEIELLPALPAAWPQGQVSGLRARGGFEVDVRWRDGRLVEATLRSGNGGAARLRYGSAVRPITLGAGEELSWDGS